jgi:hypothetical protein
MKNKNRSKTIKDGTIVQTNDRNLYSGRNYIGKPSENPKKNNRPAVVVGSNEKDELALIKITHSKKGKRLKDGVRGQRSKSRFKPIVETMDNDGKFIRIGEKFEISIPSERLSKRDLKKMERHSFRRTNKRVVNENRKRMRWLKGRKPK